jgi:hypothetical protein
MQNFKQYLKENILNPRFEKLCKKYSGGKFYCSGLQLQSLKGCPKKIISQSVYSGWFDCSHNQLSSLEFGPETVEGSYIADNNFLTDVKFLPKSIGVTSSNNIYIHDNQIVTLEGIQKTSFNKSNGTVVLYGNPIKSNILGLLLVKNMSNIQFNKEDIGAQALQIVQQNLLKNKDILECQEELIEAGLKEYAKL